MQLGPRWPSHRNCPTPSRPPGPAPPSRPCWDSCQLHPGGSVGLEGFFAQFSPAPPSGIREGVNILQETVTTPPPDPCWEHEPAAER